MYLTAQVWKLHGLCSLHGPLINIVLGELTDHSHKKSQLRADVWLANWPPKVQVRSIKQTTMMDGSFSNEYNKTINPNIYSLTFGMQKILLFHSYMIIQPLCHSSK